MIQYGNMSDEEQRAVEIVDKEISKLPEKLKELTEAFENLPATLKVHLDYDKQEVIIQGANLDYDKQEKTELKAIIRPDFNAHE